MKVIIDIPNDVYDHACSRSEDSNDEYTAMRAIAKGITIPDNELSTIMTFEVQT